ncbi:bifunctional helix-turn-helix domain-containing protein/methylated-DNA--[protein]-cysteine S-methyltransferase [Roseobacter sp. HKCCA0434]|uniref:bifunctional helix-turn-helix domain-containing protein/methylated-DNA--[protein]-cysteine S-methyltransferase n=1 Tax=Roseobacter sp. HKCCA0434 TaxID=3079297 RepID=UPI003966A78F
MNKGAHHYRLMADLLERIARQPEEPRSLAELADLADMSPAHFQRTFSQWVGVSPKRYQQYLKLNLARDLLRERSTVLDTAYGTGLSGPGRLHDLFVRWEAMSPGDYARGGEGLTIRWTWADSPFGEVLAMATDRGLCGLAFAAEIGREAAWSDLAGRWPRAQLVEGPETVGPLVDAAFGIGGQVPVHLIGAPFQIKVWEALLRIPSGHVTTYSDIAAKIGSPKAARAVGTAVGRNPVSFLVPCHRVIARSGALGGYHWGVPVKRTILAWEAARRDAREDAA